jgi:DNA-directed RNA polymerase specialized sigma24 family protein
MIDQLERLYREHLTEFRRVATAIAGNVDLGHDAVQEGFARAVRSRGRFRGDGTLEAWVWRIVVNAARDARRHTKPETASMWLSIGESPGADVPLQGLTDRQREIVFLHYFADLSYAQIAEACGVQEGTVGATLAQARAALEEQLQEESRGSS